MTSLNSEGITFKKPSDSSASTRKSQGSSRKRKCDSAPDSIHLNILRNFEGPAHTIPRRMELYSKYLEALGKHFSDVQEKYNSELTKSLDEFVKSSFTLIDETSGVVPIGILESSLSMAENAVMFDYIEKKLNLLKDDSNQKIFVARIQSSSSASTKTVFQKICSQIINEQVNATTKTDDEENDESATQTSAPRKEKNFSLYDLKVTLSTEQQQNLKIVVLIEEADYFSNSIITQLFTMMGCSDLPIVFIFGVTHGQFINNLVPFNSSSEFIVEKFYSVSAKDRLNDFMKRVLFDCNNLFKISSKVSSYLESHYKEDNFSVESLYNSIKFCLRNHFLSAGSAFCSLRKSDEYLEEELNNFVEVCNGKTASPKKRQKVSSIPPADLLKSFNEVAEGWHVCFRLLCFINAKLPERPLGESFPKIYDSCWLACSDIDNGDEHIPANRFFKALTNVNRFDFEYILTSCFQLLKAGKTIPNSSLTSSIRAALLKFATNLAEEEGQATKENSAADVKRAETNLKKKQTLKDLKQNLFELKRKNDGSSVVHSVSTKLVEYLKSLLRKYWSLMNTHDFAKVFVFDDLNVLINAMFPANFLQLNEDISNPGFSLQCECCSTLDPECIAETLPDACIIHRLISEQTTKKVDLNVIYQAFVSIVQAQATRRRSKSSSNEFENASYLIRFRKAVGELQHMGFAKRSKSKPDEISRLTWW